jgi:hypothetical protein
MSEITETAEKQIHNVWDYSRDKNGDPINADDYLRINYEKIQPGDIISYLTSNQIGNERYKVVLDDSGKKTLELIGEDKYNSEDEMGGKRKTRKHRRHRKNKKSRKGKKSRKSRKGKKSKKH